MGGLELPPAYMDFSDKDLSIHSSDAGYLIGENRIVGASGIRSLTAVRYQAC